MKLLKGSIPYKKEDVEKYSRLRWWAGLTLGDLVDKAADIYPNKEAFVDDKSRFTFSQMRERVNRYAISLMDLGIRTTDRVLVQLPNWNEFVIAYFALQKIGAIPVLLIERYRSYEIGHLFRLTGAATWIIAEQHKKTDFIPIIKDVLKNNPKVKHVVLVRGGKQRGLLNLEKMIEQAKLNEKNLARLARRRPDPMQVAHMGPTGGTTGLPKVVPRTHNCLICSIEYAAKAWVMDVHDTCLLAGPIGHDLTFTKGLGGTLFTFGKTVFTDSTDSKDICQTIQQEKATTIVWVPTLAKRLIDFDELKGYDLISLKKMHCGGGVSQPDLIKGVWERLGCTFYNGYGGTEGQTALTRSDDPPEIVLHTVGKPTCPYDIYKVVDRNGKTLPPNTQGELAIKGPGIFTGYYNAPEENKLVFDKEGFFRTGDVVKMDESGNIKITGRIKEMINRGGESISATEIEGLIMGCPGVAMAAVIPMPDPMMGERVCAYIQPKPGTSLDFDGIIAYLKERKASVLQFPERIEFIESMPFTKAEKVDKRTLLEDIVKKLSCST